MTDDVRTPIPKFGCVYRLLTVLTLVMSIVGLGTAVRAVTLPADLADFAVTTSLIPPVDGVAGLIWAVLFAWALWRLLRRRPGAAWLAWRVMLAFAVYSSVRLVLLARADYDAGRLPFLLVTLALILLATSLVRAAAQWRRKHDFGRED